MHTSHSPINIEPNYGQLFESDCEVQGGNGGGGLDLVVAGDVAHHDHSPEHAHVLHHGGGEAAPTPSQKMSTPLGAAMLSVWLRS